ncbi:hypothetical protein lerEdw1_010939 [Lerista edwardsae]|nr:hypothetical protein lerEdw1_010939 [Lerista edwardsae]
MYKSFLSPPHQGFLSRFPPSSPLSVPGSRGAAAMPLYEGLGSGGEKTAVVIDLGVAFTKCGFAGETGPRCIIPSEIKKPGIPKPVKVVQYNINTEELYSYLKEFIHMLYFRHLLVNPRDRRVVIVESVLCPSHFRETLTKVLFKYFEVCISGHLHLWGPLVSLSCWPRVGFSSSFCDLSHKSLSLYLNILSAYAAEVFFIGVFFSLQVPSVLFAPSHLMSLLTLGINSAMVLDCGYTESLVLPVSFLHVFPE